MNDNRGNLSTLDFMWTTSQFDSPPPFKFQSPPSPESGERECCLSSEMVLILREYLADEFLLIPRNHRTLSCYWSISSTRLAMMAPKKNRVDAEYREAIRLTWPAQSLFDLNYLFLQTSFASCHEYIPIPFPRGSYQAEIGWFCDDGDFIPILASNKSDSLHP